MGEPRGQERASVSRPTRHYPATCSTQRPSGRWHRAMHGQTAWTNCKEQLQGQTPSAALLRAMRAARRACHAQLAGTRSCGERCWAPPGARPGLDSARCAGGRCRRHRHGRCRGQHAPLSKGSPPPVAVRGSLHAGWPPGQRATRRRAAKTDVQVSHWSHPRLASQLSVHFHTIGTRASKPIALPCKRWLAHSPLLGDNATQAQDQCPTEGSAP